MRPNSRSSSDDVITDVLLEGLTRSETWHIFMPLQGRQARNPRRICLRDVEGKSLEVWVYAWQLPDSEARKSPYYERSVEENELAELSASAELNQSGPTVLLGYDPDTQVFVGCDVKRYLGGTPGDLGTIYVPTRIDEDILTEARISGLSFRRGFTGEVLVGIRPDNLGIYLPFAQDIHRDGAKNDIFPVLKRLGAREEVDGTFLPDAPLWLLAFVDESNKDSFKDRVREAYGFRCVLSGMQLGLFDAAHIYPKDCEDTSHLVCNGFLLQPTLHRAHDHKLIFLVLCEDGTYQFHPNYVAMNNAKEKFGHDGLRYIVDLLKKPLRKIPKAKHLRPDIRWIRKSYAHYNIEIMEHLHWKEEDEEKWRREKGLK